MKTINFNILKRSYQKQVIEKLKCYLTILSETHNSVFSTLLHLKYRFKVKVSNYSK
jgi:hypothetical protein